MTTYSGTKEFEGATFVQASFKGATLRFSDVSGVTMRSVDVDGLDIDSHDQIFTGADEMGFDLSIFRVDPPAYDEVLAVRAERQQLVTDFLATATAELLAEARENPWGGGDWHPSVGDCIRVILEEEWAHLRYIRRDLARLR